MPKSDAQAESEILTQVNSELSQKSEGVRINNRNLNNSHPVDCTCTICNEFYDDGKKISHLDEVKKRKELDYPYVD
jgi:hypothetical protein